MIREAEERLLVDKRDVDGGSVHVRSYVHEVPVEERIRLRQERSIDVNEHSEEAVVSKETVITGEVEVSKDVETEERVVSDTVRKTEVEVDDDTTRR